MWRRGGGRDGHARAGLAFPAHATCPPPTSNMQPEHPTPLPPDYGSNLGDFLDAHDLANLTDIRSVHDLASSMQEVEAAFCDQRGAGGSEWCLRWRPGSAGWVATPPPPPAPNHPRPHSPTPAASRPARRCPPSAPAPRSPLRWCPRSASWRPRPSRCGWQGRGRCAVPVSAPLLACALACPHPLSLPALPFRSCATPPSWC